MGIHSVFGIISFLCVTSSRACVGGFVCACVRARAGFIEEVEVEGTECQRERRTESLLNN